jgi:hypothetical protein
MAGRCIENVIEWISGEETALCTFSQKRYANRIRRLSEKYAELVEIIAENEDGSILARIPLSAIHITIYTPKTGGFAGVPDTTEDCDDDE